MKISIYHKLARVLDILPNGFPATESCLEIKLLKKVFTPGEAALFCDLRLNCETAEQIAERTGRPLEGLEATLTSMWERGEIWGTNFNGTRSFKMIPWIPGIYELQLNRMDNEFAQLAEEYKLILGPKLLMMRPQLMQVIPIEEEIPYHQEALSFQQVSTLINRSQSFGASDCVCNKNKKLIGKGCDKARDVCIALSSEPGAFDNHPLKHAITRNEAIAILKRSEEAALVHLTANVQDDQTYICNCCSCCCPVLEAAQLFGRSDLINSRYYAEIDSQGCDCCGVCWDDRCQVNAILTGESHFHIVADKCIGCGLCISTCPTDAIKLIPKDPERISRTPRNEKNWFEERGRRRGVDYSQYID